MRFRSTLYRRHILQVASSANRNRSRGWRELPQRYALTKSSWCEASSRSQSAGIAGSSLGSIQTNKPQDWFVPKAWGTLTWNNSFEIAYSGNGTVYPKCLAIFFASEYGATSANL